MHDAAAMQLDRALACVIGRRGESQPCRLDAHEAAALLVLVAATKHHLRACDSGRGHRRTQHWRQLERERRAANKREHCFDFLSSCISFYPVIMRVGVARDHTTPVGITS